MEQNTNKTSEKFAVSVNCCYFCRRITKFVIRTLGYPDSIVSLKGCRTSFLEYLISRFPGPISRTSDTKRTKHIYIK